MATINSGNKTTRSHSHHHSSFTRVHQIAALALVAATFFLTRLFDHSLAPCSHANHYSTPDHAVRSRSHMNLKIYVYEKDEIDGLQLLLSGRDGKISADACVKGQWGTQYVWKGLAFFCILVLISFGARSWVSLSTTLSSIDNQGGFLFYVVYY